MRLATKQERFHHLVNSILKLNLNITRRTIPYEGGRLAVLYIKQLTDTKQLSENVIRPLVSASPKICLTAELAMNRFLYAADCSIKKNTAKIVDSILSGQTVILFSTDTAYLTVNLQKIERRTIPTPEIEFALRAGRDSFIENLDTNISLIRYRIKDKNLRIKMLEAGKRTKTRIAIIYLEDVANDTVVSELEKRIERIDVDGVVESGELQSLLLNNRNNLFPQMGLVERSDMACRLLLSGRVITLVEGSGLGLSAPAAFIELFYSCDDLYENRFFGLFMRIIRYISAFTTLTASSVYVALTSFHTDAMPADYAILLAEMNSRVPFPSVVGAFLLEFLIEVIRESLLRVPRHIGSAIGIVGAIVIGQAAISAGLFSPLMLIIASVSLLTSFVAADYTLANSFRILKFMLLIITGFFGFYGFTLFLCLILSALVSLNSFGVPYMAPFAPFNLYDFIRGFIDNTAMSPLRMKYLRTKDNRRKKRQTKSKNAGSSWQQ